MAADTHEPGSTAATDPAPRRRPPVRLLIVMGIIAVVLAILAVWLVRTFLEALLGHAVADEDSAYSTHRLNPPTSISAPQDPGSPAPGVQYYDGTGTEPLTVQ